jgi:hypothetical protein
MAVYLLFHVPGLSVARFLIFRYVFARAVLSNKGRKRGFLLVNGLMNVYGFLDSNESGLSLLPRY